VALSKTLSNELARDNILVNTVCPGYTMTKRVEELANRRAAKDGISPKDVFTMWEGMIPMGRMGRAEEFANLVVFLASERASYITGVTIQVDGGYVKSAF
jgi:3-oxoacyl-[acyl-carrier protein] reductase